MKVALLVLVVLAFAVLEALIGGTRLVFALPGLGLVAAAGALSLWPTLRTNRNFSVFAVGSTLLFLAYLLIRNRLSPVDYVARVTFVTELGCFVMYLLGVFLLDRSRERKWLFLMLLLMALAQVVYGFMQFKQGHQTISLPWASRLDEWWRASGFYISPNHFAGYLELMALMAFSFVFWGRLGMTLKILIGYVGLMCIAGVAMSGSRGGYLSFSFGAVVFILLSLVGYRRLFPQRFWVISAVTVVGAAALFGAAISVMLTNTSVRERLMTVNDPSNMRLQLWDAAWQQFQVSPVFGTGAFTYIYYGRLFRDPRVQNDPIHVHNDYLQLLADYGIIAAALFVLVYIAHVIAGLRGFGYLLNRTADAGDTQSDGLALCIGALSGLAAYTVHSVVDFNMHIPVNALLMTFLLAILASPSGQGFEQGRVGRLFGNSSRWVLLPAVSVVLLAFVGKWAEPEWYGEKARVAMKEYRLEDALKNAKAGLKKDPQNVDLYYYAGESAREMAAKGEGDPVQLRLWAAHYLTQGLKLFPGDSRLSVKLAHAYSDMGRYEEAVQALSLAEEWDPHSSYPLAYRGLVELQAGYLDDALGYFQEALALDGQNQIARAGAKAAREALKKAPGFQPIPAAPAEETPAEEDNEPLPPPEPSLDGTP